MSGPLVVSTDNPRYFADANGRCVYLCGSHTWDNFKDHGPDNPPTAFDYTNFLDYLETWNHNCFRLWAWELPYSSQIDLANWYHAPWAWQRTGPGTATDGGDKFDLTKFNQSYFDRMASRISQAEARGMYVIVMLWDGFDPQFERETANDGFPFDTDNNINSIDVSGTDYQTLNNSAVTAIQEAYLEKVVDTVNGYDNVLYEIANESGSYSTSWQAHMIDYIHTYEAGKAKQHPVGFTFQYAGGSDATLYASSAEWVSPSENLPAASGNKVILLDTDHAYWWVTMQGDGTAAQQAWAWKAFCKGNQCLFMDPFTTTWTGRNSPSGTTPDSYWNVLRLAIGRTRLYADKLNLNLCTPQPTLFSQGYGLANAAATNAQYLAYLPSGGSVTVDLSATPGKLKVEWFNPSTGAVSTDTPVDGGASRELTAPFGGDAVLFLNGVRHIVMFRRP